MRNIEQRGNRYRAQVFRRGVRVTKSFATVEQASLWVAERKAEIEASGKLALPSTARRRTDYRHATFAVAPDLLSFAEIIRLAKPRPAVCGIYFLVRAEAIVYVGQSVDVHRRIAAHLPHRQFDAFHIIECEAKDLPVLESKYILALQPAWNRNRLGRLVLSVHRDTPSLAA